MEIWFLIDIILYFFREFEDENTPMPIRQFDKIAVRYLKGSFCYDFLAIFPFVMIIDSFLISKRKYSHDDYDPVNLLYLFKFLRLQKTNDVLSPMFFSTALKQIYQSRLDYIIQSTKHFDDLIDYNKIVQQIRISYMFQIIRLGFIVFFTSYILALFSWILLDIEHKGLADHEDNIGTFIHIYELEH